MSFFSNRNSMGDICPGRIQGEASRGLCERACIQVKKVYDSCLQQEQFDNVIIHPECIKPPIEDIRGLQFISTKSSTSRGKVRDVSITPLEDRPHLARVRCVVDIPCEVIFSDPQGQIYRGEAVICVKKDVVLYVPCESVIPYFVEAVVSAISVSGEYLGNLNFSCTICVTVILKIVAEVELLIPTYGFCRIPPCESFSENVCDGFFSLPIFPPTGDCDNDCD